MGIRGGLIIGAGLILTVLMTFPVLLMTGGTLQRISLGAFIVAMGMLVDNAVVVLDGILVDRGNGLPPKKALFRTAENTAWPLMGATLIAIMTFLPVGLSNDTVFCAGHIIVGKLGACHDTDTCLCKTILIGTCKRR